jgi:hypothetical protein
MAQQQVGIALVSAALMSFPMCGGASTESVSAQLRALLDTTYAPPTGSVIRVHSGEDLQAALAASASVGSG